MPKQNTEESQPNLVENTAAGVGSQHSGTKEPTDVALSIGGVSTPTPVPLQSSTTPGDTDPSPPTSHVSTLGSVPLPTNNSTGPSTVGAESNLHPRSDEDKAMAAIISINKVNILDPPRALVFGVFNPRTLVQSGVKSLVNDFLYELCTPFKMECMIPVLLRRDDIEPSCIGIDPRLGPATPDLLLTAQGKKLTEIRACGGKHRLAAVKEIHTLLEKQWNTLNDRMKTLTGESTGKEGKGKKGMGKGKTRAKRKAADDADGDNSDGNNSDGGDTTGVYTIAGLQSQMEDIRARQSRYSTWGVIIYDIDIVRSQSIGAHLSKNKEHVRTIEDDAEGFHMNLRQYSDLQKTVSPEALQEHIAAFKSKDNTKSPLPRIMRCSEILELQLRFFNFAPIFHLKPQMSKTWISKNLMAVSGGFIIAYAEYSLKSWWCLFSSAPLDSIDGDCIANWSTYCANCVSTTGSEHKRAQLIGRSTWDAFTSSAEPVEPAFTSTSVFSALEGIAKPITDSPDYFGAIGDTTWDGMITEYKESISSDIEGLIVPIEDHRGIDLSIKLALDRKLEWMVFPHQKLHYAPLLPLVTPKVLDCVAQVFQQIPKALTEFMSWICPVAPYIVTGSKNFDTPSDLSTFVIRSLRLNGDRTFKKTEMGRVINHFSFFPFKHLREFHQLELDLLSYPSKPRPLSSGEQVMSKLEAIHGPGVKQAAEAMVATIRPLVQSLGKERKKQSQSKDETEAQTAIPDRLFVDLWPLNPKGFIDWRDNNALQNSSREWLKFSTYAKLEMDITATYRAQLLNGSQAAAFLRSAFKTTMDPFCGKREVEYFGGRKAPVVLTGWHYADPYGTPDSPSPPIIDLDNIIVTREARRIEAEERKVLTTLLSKVHAMKIFTASITTGLLDDDIAAILPAFEEAALKNIKRRSLMKEAQDRAANQRAKDTKTKDNKGDEEDDIDIDPYDEKYSLSNVKIIPIDFKRNKGFSGDPTDDEVSDLAPTPPPPSSQPRGLPGGNARAHGSHKDDVRGPKDVEVIDVEMGLPPHEEGDEDASCCDDDEATKDNLPPPISPSVTGSDTNTTASQQVEYDESSPALTPTTSEYLRFDESNTDTPTTTTHIPASKRTEPDSQHSPPPRNTKKPRV